MLTYAYQLGTFGSILCARPARRTRSLTFDYAARIDIRARPCLRRQAAGGLRNTGTKDFYERLTPLEAILTSARGRARVPSLIGTSSLPYNSLVINALNNALIRICQQTTYKSFLCIFLREAAPLSSFLAHPYEK